MVRNSESSRIFNTYPKLLELVAIEMTSVHLLARQEFWDVANKLPDNCSALA